MTQVATLYTKMEISLYEELKIWIKKKNITQRVFVEEALKNYLQKLSKDEIEAQYLEMGKDEDYIKEMRTNASLLGNI